MSTSGAAATTWHVVPGHSEITFEATQLGAPFEGRFTDFQSEILFDPADLGSASATVVITIASVETGNDDRNAQIVGADWFDAATHPTARFETTAFRRNGSGYVAEGRLTLRDISRTVELPFRLDIDGADAVMTGQLTVSRSDFGIGRGQWTDTAVVGDAVTIRVRLTAQAR